MKYIKVLILLLLTLILSSCKEEITFKESSIITSRNDLIIEIKGEVIYPGIYTLEEGALLIDAVKLAGGFSPYADTSNINLVSIISNNQLIIIPKKDENTNSSTYISDLININKASLDDLMTLPGIGESKARKIIDSHDLCYIGEFGVILNLALQIATYLHTGSSLVLDC
jgi:DNA uptake protein ComE-like DNA-binding protein